MPYPMTSGASSSNSSARFTIAENDQPASLLQQAERGKESAALHTPPQKNVVEWNATPYPMTSGADSSISSASFTNADTASALSVDALFVGLKRVKPQRANLLSEGHVNNLHHAFSRPWEQFNVLLRTNMYTLASRRPCVLGTHALQLGR